jgi:hypothetical protein
MSLQDVPHVLEELYAANDPAVVHVPLVVDRAQRLNLVHQAVDAATEIQGS